MKRFLVLLCAALLLTACHDASQDPVIKGYRLQQVSRLSMGVEGVTADMVLSVDVDNPSKARYTLESLAATLYRGNETARFADVVMENTASIAPKSAQTVDLPLHVTLLRPLALLSGGQDALDLSQYCADVDLTVRKGSLKKTIRKERLPLKQLEYLLGSRQNTETK